MKKRVYIAGTNKVAFLFQDLLDPERVDFMGYVSTNTEMKDENSVSRSIWGGYPLITFEQYKEKQADYLIICDDMELDIFDPRNIKLNHSLSVAGMYLGGEYYIYRKKALRDMKDKDVCGIITGMSYAQRGINTELLSKAWCMCAYPSQDLYYDFFTLADAIKRLNGKLKYIIMGIAPYSFRYDLSLSKGVQEKVYYYFREFGELHNSVPPKDELERMVGYDKALDELCVSNWRDICFTFLADSTFQHSEHIYDFNSLSKEQQLESIEVMEKIANKPFDDTLAENKMVFDMCLKLCARQNIKVMVLITPYSEFFRKHFPMEYVEETRNIIAESRKKYDFELLDLYDSPDYSNDKYYMDEAHMNIYGADKLSREIEEFLCERIY